jgi:hypothetical protein
MDYKYEIFISYKWGGPRKEWVDKIFLPLLEDALDNIFPTNQNVFKDTRNIQPGATLDLSLQDALAHSKLMICIVSLPYFTKSVWCPTEFSAMLYREEQLEIRKQGNHFGLIFPVVFVDDAAQNINDRCPLYEYQNLRDLIFNMSPLELNNKKYNNANEAFLASQNFIDLKNIIYHWVDQSLRPVLQQMKPWQNQWTSPEYIINPYQTYRDRYNVTQNPVQLPSVR